MDREGRRMRLQQRLAGISAASVVAVVALATAGVASAATGAGTPPSAGAIKNPSTAKDYSIIARDIIPSGQYGAIPSPALLPKEEQQAEMYNALTPLFNHVTTADVFKDFKSEAVGKAVTGALTPDPQAPDHAGLTILRDAYNVPHIYGATRDDVTWGAGWVEAEDRNLLLSEARYDALLAAVDAPGVSAIGLIGSLASFKPTAQLQNTVAQQTNALMKAGAEGRDVLHDIDVYLAGINAPRRRRSPGPTSTPSTRSKTSSWARAEASRRPTASSSLRSSSTWERRRGWRCGTTSARRTTPRRRSASPATSGSRRPRRASPATYSWRRTA
jgi:hypothetical protein